MANYLPFMDYNSPYTNPLYYSFPSYTIDSEGNVVFEMPEMAKPYDNKREFFKFLKENKLFGEFCRGIAESVQSEISYDARHWMAQLGYERTYKYLFTNPREYTNSLINDVMSTTFKEHPIEQSYMLYKLINETPRNSFKMV